MGNKPDKKNKFYQFFESIKHNKDIFPFLELMVTLIGFIFIYFQLLEFNNQNQQLKIQTKALVEQNKTLNKSLIQSYRPIGYVGFESNQDAIAQIVNHTKDEKVDFIYRPRLINRGNGPLIFIGFIYYASIIEINFKEDLLAGKYLTDFKFDYNYRRTRKTALLKDQSTSVNCEINNIDLTKKYNIYILIFYSDQDGNLYDTEHLMYFENIIEPKSDKIKNNHIAPFMRNKYEMISDVERQGLIQIFKDRRHELYKFF